MINIFVPEYPSKFKFVFLRFVIVKNEPIFISFDSNKRFISLLNIFEYRSAF